MAVAKLAAVITALDEHYEVIRHAGPKLYIQEHPYSEYVDEYVRENLSGKVSLLEFNVWQFTDIPTNTDLNFGEHLELVELNGVINLPTVATTIERHQFPVRQLSATEDLQDVLIVNVVEPNG